MSKSADANDMSAMREALSDACYAMFNFLKTQQGGYEEMAKALDKAKAALAAPARNCDVYDAKTAEKQFIRQTGSKSIRSKSVRWLYAPYNSEAAES